MDEPAVTVADVLEVDYPGTPAWTGDGSAVVAPIHEGDGQAVVVAPTDGEARRSRPGTGSVASVAPAPNDDRFLVATDEGQLHLATVGDDGTTQLADVPTDDAAFTWGPEGRQVAYYHDGRPWVRDLEAGSEQGFDAPDRGPYLGESRMFAWRDPDTVAYRFVDEDVKQVGVLDCETGELVWRSRSGDFSTSVPEWLADGRLLVERTGDRGRIRQVVAVDIESGTEAILFEEVDREHGVVSGGAPEVAPDGRHVAMTRSRDGWAHVYVVDLDGTVDQLTDGAFEDRGVAGASPQWLDERTLVFASNRRAAGERQVFAVDLEGTTRPLVTSDGTNVHPRPSPDGTRMAYVHASADRSPELRVIRLTSAGDGPSSEADGATPRRVTTATVDDWPVAPIHPREVTYEGAEGETITGYLMDPRDTTGVADDASDLPAVVYVHGGPMRQMRAGWHPSRSYGLAYAVHQYLAQRGYVGLFVNYRGGIGYGRAFRRALAGHRGDHEIRDIVAGAEYLAAQPFVDGDAIGTWGLSYGGYTTLQVLGTHPETFAVGVNLAGLADLVQYREWAYETKYPAAASGMDVRLGGAPWEAPDAWAAASPKTHMDQYEAPLYSFHGTDDQYVDFEQLDVVIDRLLDADAEFTAQYYPDESHVFERRSTWRHTVRRIEAAFDDHLKS